MKILFLHGWHSVPGGVKPTYLSQHGHTVLNPQLPDDDFGEAVRIAQAEFDKHQPQVVVGSSRGGAGALNINSGDAKLVLLCPAWNKFGTTRKVKPGTIILHSRGDDVIPFADSEELVKNSSLSESTLVEVGNDHRLVDPESLEALLKACIPTSVRVIGCDFGAPKKAGDQAKKIILLEAVKVGKLHYSIQPTGRNARLLREYSKDATWKEKRRGWTLPDLAQSLIADTTINVAVFDFPFSLPLALLNDVDFASQMGQAPFLIRAAWARFMSNRLRLAFDNETMNGEMQDLAQFEPWRDKKYWVRRATDSVTNGSPPLKHKFQNVFAMTLAGTALLSFLELHGYKTLLDSAIPIEPSCLIETYPRAVANRVGFTGSYKANPDNCLQSAIEFLLKQGIQLDFDSGVRRFCETYRTSTNDPDGADAFLCLVTAITCHEGMAEICGGQASKSVLTEEGVIVVPSLNRS